MRKLTDADGYYSRFPEGYVFDWDGDNNNDDDDDDDDDDANASTCQQQQPQQQSMTCVTTADAALANGSSASSSSSSSTTTAPSLPLSASSSATASSAVHDAAESATPTATATAAPGLAECAVKLFAMGGSHEHFLQAVVQGLRLRQSFLLDASSAYAAPPPDAQQRPTMAVCGGQRPLLLLYTDDDKVFTQWSGDRLALLVRQLRNATEAVAVAVRDDLGDYNDHQPVSPYPVLPSAPSSPPTPLSLPPPITPSSVLAIFDRIVPLSALQPLMPPADHYPTDTAIREYLYMHKMDSFHHAPSLWLHRALSFIHAGQHLAKAVLQLDADVMPCQEDVVRRVFCSLGHGQGQGHGQGPDRFDLVTVVDPNELYGGTNREPRYPYPAQHFHTDWAKYPERLLHFLLVTANTFLSTHKCMHEDTRSETPTYT